MSRTQRISLSVAVMLAVVGMGGCVERRYTIRSDPPGALAIVNGEEKGTTPISSSYVFYGKRSIRLVKDGYEPLDIVQDFPAPWYDNMLTEIVTENLIPYTFRDERTLTYTLKPETQTDPAKLLGNAEALRAEARTLPPPRRGGILGFFGFD
ncbi:MAG TPA: PEGA domain-containing protein [Isosphaeraceae bacterium]